MYSSAITATAVTAMAVSCHYQGGGNFVGGQFHGRLFVFKEGGEIFPWRHLGVGGIYGTKSPPQGYGGGVWGGGGVPVHTKRQ